MKYSVSYHNAMTLQRIVMAKARDPEISNADLKALTGSFIELERLKRDMRMKPNPKPVDVPIDNGFKPRQLEPFTEP